MNITQKIKKKIKKVVFGNESKGFAPNPNRRIKFGQTVYIPRWRFKNYFAVKEFGEDHIRWFIEQRYMYELKQFPDLDNPKLFNEKIHWLNLNYKNDLITRCCDKVELKKYVSEKVGLDYVVPNIAIYDKVNEIEFQNLPNRFAIKVNWGDGEEFCEIVKDKSKADLDKIKAKMNNAIQPWNNLYYSHFFWGYKNVKPKILVEEFLDSGEKSINDYKVHCFNGKTKFVLVCEERYSDRMKKTYLDTEWNVLPFHRADADVNKEVQKPNNFEIMLEIAEVLAEPFPFVRVDFYNMENKIYVGEMTFHPGCGWEEFLPKEWNRKIGDMLDLTEIMEKEK